MKIFLLTLLILAATHGAPYYKTKREILPGDLRYGTDYQHQHSISSDVNQFSQYLPPNIQFEKTEGTKQNLELPSTSYGVPFRPDATHVESAPQLQHIEHQFTHQVPVPHSTYGVPVQQQQRQIYPTQQEVKWNHLPASAHIQNNQQVQHIQHQVQQVQQPTSFYGVPISQQQYNTQPVHQAASVQIQSNKHEEHQQAQQVHQVHQTASVYGAPFSHQHQRVQTLHRMTPIHPQSNQDRQYYEELQQIPHQLQQVSSLVYGSPIENHQQQIDQTHTVHVNNERLIFEAPIQSVEVSQSHLVENAPTASASVNIDNDAVSIAAAGAKESVFGGYKYTQPTSSNGGYVY